MRRFLLLAPELFIRALLVAIELTPRSSLHSLVSLADPFGIVPSGSKILCKTTKAVAEVHVISKELRIDLWGSSVLARKQHMIRKRGAQLLPLFFREAVVASIAYEELLGFVSSPQVHAQVTLSLISEYIIPASQPFQA